jgi:hypothetical protein
MMVKKGKPITKLTAAKSQAQITAKHTKRVLSALREAAKAEAKIMASSAGACTITFGGGFKVCRDNVTKDACNQVAKLMGGTSSFVPGGKCS